MFFNERQVETVSLYSKQFLAEVFAVQELLTRLSN